MKIEGKVKTDKILTVDDLKDGEVFIFKDNPNDIFLKKDYSEFVVNLETGELYELSFENWYCRAIERVKYKLVIE